MSFRDYLALVKAEPDLWSLIPVWVGESPDLETALARLRTLHPEIRGRSEFVSAGFAALYELVSELERSTSRPGFVWSTDAYVARLYTVLKARAATRAIGALYTAKRFEWVDLGVDFGMRNWCLLLHLPYEKVYSRYSKEEWAGTAEEIEAATNEVGRGDDSDWISRVGITSIIPPTPGWRPDALGVLTGNRSSVNNQANVRSDNPPYMREDGLYFRSRSEICIYKALKAEGVVFAPLPVFLQGGKAYRRVEPDFVILRKNHVTILEIDGDAFHQENPAEAQERLGLFSAEGADTVHVKAEDCDTDEKAKATVRKLLVQIDKRREGR